MVDTGLTTTSTNMESFRFNTLAPAEQVAERAAHEAHLADELAEQRRYQEFYAGLIANKPPPVPLFNPWDKPAAAAAPAGPTTTPSDLDFSWNPKSPIDSTMESMSEPCCTPNFSEDDDYEFTRSNFDMFEAQLDLYWLRIRDSTPYEVPLPQPKVAVQKHFEGTSVKPHWSSAVEGLAHAPKWRSLLVIMDRVYRGPPCNTKKEAEDAVSSMVTRELKLAKFSCLWEEFVQLCKEADVPAPLKTSLVSDFSVDQIFQLCAFVAKLRK